MSSSWLCSRDTCVLVMPVFVVSYCYECMGKHEFTVNPEPLKILPLVERNALLFSAPHKHQRRVKSIIRKYVEANWRDERSHSFERFGGQDQTYFVGVVIKTYKANVRNCNKSDAADVYSQRGCLIDWRGRAGVLLIGDTGDLAVTRGSRMALASMREYW